jgi:cation/acetate symporter
MQPWFFGVSAEGIGTVGMVLNFLVTIIVSCLTPPPPIAVQEMIQDLRIPEAAPPALEDLGEEELD